MSAILLELGVAQDDINVFTEASNVATVAAIDALIGGVKAADGRIVNAALAANVLAITFDVAGVMTTSTFVTLPR